MRVSSGGRRAALTSPLAAKLPTNHSSPASDLLLRWRFFFTKHYECADRIFSDDNTFKYCKYSFEKLSILIVLSFKKNAASASKDTDKFFNHVCVHETYR
jgi:hypothetical protein